MTASPPRCVLDSGGLSALTGRSARSRAWLRWIVEHGGEIIVPTPILVETITGDVRRDAETNRILGVLARQDLAIVAPDEHTARRAGTLRYRARSDDGVDALVAAAAAEGTPCVVLTSDPTDLLRLLVNEPKVAVRAV